MIANHPKYQQSGDKGGDLAFTSCSGSTGEGIPIQNFAIGDNDGNPLNMTGWRASCMMMWNTDEGGPCILRPTTSSSPDGPAANEITASFCVSGIDDEGKCEINQWCARKGCECDENNIPSSCIQTTTKQEPTTPWSEDLSSTEKTKRHAMSWNNQFAFPWEIGMFWKFSVGGVGQRAIGCPGIDEEFGTVANPKWPFRNSNSPIFHSKALQCEVNDYAPEGRPVHEIVDELASDNEIFAEKFLEGWHQMTINGYCEEDLVAGPENGWMGHYSLTQQGVEIEDFEAYISEHAPVDFTDVQADPWVCGHRGHATTSCGYRFSRFFELAKTGTNGCVFWDKQQVD